MIEVKGTENNVARTIRDSVSPEGVRLITYELEFNRFILAETNTHKMISKNSMSSRAIPSKKMIEMILETPGMPVYWGKNQPGMTAKEELSGTEKQYAIDSWLKALHVTAKYAETLSSDLNVHKQISNRMLEPWMVQKAVFTGTEWNNFFWLRNHPDAQPEFRELAACMWEARQKSTPVELKPGDWHLPYVNEFDHLSLNEAQKVSMSCVAQVSYRKNDDSIEKAVDIYNKLNLGSTEQPAHASPTEHLATPMTIPDNKWNPDNWQSGITHIDRNSQLWSGNLRGWIQYRKLIPNESVAY